MTKHARPVRDLVVRNGGTDGIYDPRLRTYAPVRDRTDELGALPQHPVPASEVERFLSRRRGGIHALGELQGGVTYKPGQLHYRESTAVYYYLLAPREKSGPAGAELLYMTATNRSYQGCEALIAFPNPEPYSASFRIWDWYCQRLAGSAFIRSWKFSQLGSYLIPYIFNESIETDVLYVISSTRKIGRDRWVNEVYLHNRDTGERDRVWSQEFPWPDAPANDEWGWWGPIFEAFPNGATLGPCNPIGFDATILVQDGYERQLTDENSTLTPPANDGLTTVYRSGNSGLVAK